jgi:hypothetical protein
MKVGLSYSRCVYDIVKGHINEEEVLVVIARTNFDPTDDNQWNEIWGNYVFSEWHGYDYFNKEHNDLFRNVTLSLYNNGKLHQPRKFGAHPYRRSEYWLETVLVSEDLEKNAAAKKAWDHFQMISRLTNISLDKEYK